MYLNYFGLVERPFSIAPDPQYLYMSQRHKEAMAHLSYGLSQGGCFIVLTGEVGTGKTTLCRNLLADLPSNVDVALILNPNINRRELLETVCDELKIEYSTDQSKKSIVDLINEHLLNTYAENRHTVLIIDEAQLLSRDVLEQVRLLTNLETTKAKLLQIILIGQPELNDLLTREDLRQLAQRVTARYHLPAIGRDEIHDYVNFRLGVAGCKKPLFSAQALKLLHKLTDGIPRKINVLADHALLGAYSKSEVLVDSKTLKQSAHDVFLKPTSSVPTRIKPVWLGGLAVAALLATNVGLWWWFSADQTSQLSKAPVTELATQARNESEMALDASLAVNSVSDVIDGAADALDTPEKIAADVLRKDDGTSSNSETLIDLSGLSDSAPLTTSVVTPANVTPGSVVISEEYLDDALDVVGLTNADEPTGPTTVISTQTALPPAYLDTTAFGRVLEVSPDRTGRVATFRNLAAAWDVELPNQLLGPLCDELAVNQINCLPASSWAGLRRYNRPTIMVLRHKGVDHRVILYRLEEGVASVLVGEQSYDLPVSELRDRWSDNAIVFWRPSDIGDEFLKVGTQNQSLPKVRKVLNQLFAQLDMPILSNVDSPLFDDELAAKTRQLQLRFDIVADGKIGRETYLLINELLDSEGVPTLTNRG